MVDNPKFSPNELVGDESLDIPYIPVAEFSESAPRKEANAPQLNAWQKLVATTAFGPVVAFTILLIGLALAVNLVGLDNLGTQVKVDKSVDIPLDNIGAKARTSLPNAEGLDVDGSLKVQGTLVLVPNSQPANPQTGSIYIDDTTAKIYYYDGTVYRVLVSDDDEDSSFVELQTAGGLDPQAGSLALTGTVSANSLVGSGAGITDLNAANISTGTISNGLLAGQGAITILAGIRAKRNAMHRESCGSGIEREDESTSRCVGGAG